MHVKKKKNMATAPKEQAFEGTGRHKAQISGVEAVVLSSCSPVCLSIYLIANNHYLAVTSWQMINDTWWMTLSGACPWSASLPSPLTTTWDSHDSAPYGQPHIPPRKLSFHFLKAVNEGLWERERPREREKGRKFSLYPNDWPLRKEIIIFQY